VPFSNYATNYTSSPPPPRNAKSYYPEFVPGTALFVVVGRYIRNGHRLTHICTRNGPDHLLPRPWLCISVVCTTEVASPITVLPVNASPYEVPDFTDARARLVTDIDITVGTTIICRPVVTCAPLSNGNASAIRVFDLVLRISLSKLYSNA